MAKDGKALRVEAAEATAAGKHKRALAAYLELERIESRDAQWAKRAAETYRRLGNNKNAVEAYERSAERYAQNGFLVQAMAVCKLILQIDPLHEGTLGRLAQMNEQVGAGPTRAQGYADNNPELHTNPNVAAIRRGTGAESAIPQLDPRQQVDDGHAADRDVADQEQADLAAAGCGARDRAPREGGPPVVEQHPRRDGDPDRR